MPRERQPIDPEQHAQAARQGVAYLRGAIDEKRQLDTQNPIDRSAFIDSICFQADLPDDEYWQPTETIAEMYEQELLPDNLKPIGEHSFLVWQEVKRKG